MDQHEKAAAFRAMHLEPPILVLPNAWDVASAKAFAGMKGCRALATSSAAVARSLGWEDGERAPVDEMIEAARRIAAAVEVPVTADLERGYGDPVGTAKRAWEAGLVGLNVEDSSREGLFPIDEQVAVIARDARSGARARDQRARRRVSRHRSRRRRRRPPNARMRISRPGRTASYPILAPVDSLPALLHRIHGPINVIAEKGTPSPAELQELGVARMTWGSGLATLAYAKAVKVAADALG